MTSSALMLIVLAQAYLMGLASSSVPSVGEGNATWVQGSGQSFDEPLHRRGPPQKLPGYTYTPYIGGFKVHTVATTWKRARSICWDEGGVLAVINSEAEAKVVAQMLFESGPHVNSDHPDFAWFGIRTLNRGQGDNWETAYGNTFELAADNKWDELPVKKRCNCGAVSRDRKMNSFGCDEFLGFVCQGTWILNEV